MTMSLRDARYTENMCTVIESTALLDAADELSRRVSRVLDNWAETTDPGTRNRDLWTPMHRANEAYMDAKWALEHE